MNIPDEVISAAIKMAFNGPARTTCGKQEAAADAPVEQLETLLAKRAKTMLDAFVAEGFTQEQAFDLVKAILAGRRK